MNPKHAPEAYVDLKAQGLSNYEIADRLEVDEASVRRGLRKAGWRPPILSDELLQEAADARAGLDRPILHDIALDGGIAVTADWHHPLSDYAFVNQFLEHCRDLRVKTLAVAGDWFNADAVSQYYPKQEAAGMLREVRASAISIEAALGVFDRVIITSGNHDYRYVKALQYRLAFKDAMRMLFADVGAEFIDRVVFSNLDYMMVSETETGLWYVAHPKEYSRIPLRVPRELASKHLANVMGGHSHHTAVGFDKSGEFICVELGGFFDNKAFQFTQASTTFPVWTPGYSIIDDSGHLHVEAKGWSTGRIR